MSPSVVLMRTVGCAAGAAVCAKAEAFAIRAALPSANNKLFMKFLGVEKRGAARAAYCDGATYGGMASDPFEPAPYWNVGEVVMTGNAGMGAGAGMAACAVFLLDAGGEITFWRSARRCAVAPLAWPSDWARLYDSAASRRYRSPRFSYARP